MRSKVQTITPAKAAEWLEANTQNRPISKRTVEGFAEAMRRGEWKVTHQGIAFDETGALVDGQHRLAAIVEAGLPVEMTVFTQVPADGFDVLDTGKKRNAADVLAIEGEKSSIMLAAMVRIVWLYENRQDRSWSGGGATPTNHQIVETLDAHPDIRDYLGLSLQVATATGMIKSAAGGAVYLVTKANPKANLDPFFDGLIEGTGLRKGDAALMFRKHLFAQARKQAGQVLRRRDQREHVTLFIKAFNAWAGGERLTQLRYTPREAVPPITRIR